MLYEGFHEGGAGSQRLDTGVESEGIGRRSDGLSNLVDAAAETPTERVLDSFHISMRLQPIEQMSSKIAMALGDSDTELKQLLTEKGASHSISAPERQTGGGVGAYRGCLSR